LQSHNPYLDWIFKKKALYTFTWLIIFLILNLPAYTKPGISKWQHDHWVCKMAQVIIYWR
jgi:hypothetical protein